MGSVHRELPGLARCSAQGGGGRRGHCRTELRRGRAGRHRGARTVRCCAPERALDDAGDDRHQHDPAGAHRRLPLRSPAEPRRRARALELVRPSAWAARGLRGQARGLCRSGRRAEGLRRSAPALPARLALPARRHRGDRPRGCALERGDGGRHRGRLGELSDARATAAAPRRGRGPLHRAARHRTRQQAGHECTGDPHRGTARQRRPLRERDRLSPRAGLWPEQRGLPPL